MTHLIAALLLADQAETHSDLVKRLTANDLRVAELSIKQNRASQTAQKLGAVRSAATLVHALLLASLIKRLGMTKWVFIRRCGYSGLPSS